MNNFLKKTHPKRKKTGHTFPNKYRCGNGSSQKRQFAVASRAIPVRKQTSVNGYGKALVKIEDGTRLIVWVTKKAHNKCRIVSLVTDPGCKLEVPLDYIKLQ